MSRTITFSHLPGRLSLVWLTGGVKVIFFYNLCSNSEPISLRRGDFNLILILVLILGSVQCELYGW